MKVKREALLNAIHNVSGGLANNELVEQSSCFVFGDGKVYTFNDEIALHTKSPIQLNGAIQSGPITKFLEKRKDEFFTCAFTETTLSLKTKTSSTQFKVEPELHLPIKTIQKPGKFKKVSPYFKEALGMVQTCVSKNEETFIMTLLHITPTYIEACDNHQAARYIVKTPIKSEILIRREVAKHIINLNMEYISVTSDWIHFRDSEGTVLSCRKHTDDYPNISKIMKVEGSTSNLPKGIKEIALVANIFSSDNIESTHILVELNRGKIKIVGSGATGRHTEVKRIKYSGPQIQFLIAAELLASLADRHTTCVIAANRIKVSEGRFRYVTATGTPLAKPTTKKKRAKKQ